MSLSPQPGRSVIKSRVRIETWDALRILAALDAAAMHLTGGHALLGVGLPIFLLLSVALAASKTRPQDSRALLPITFLRRRAERLLLPWMFWSWVFAVVRVVTSLLDGKHAFSWFVPTMWFYGPRIHLWFLPTIFVFGVTAHAAAGLFPPVRVAAAGRVHRVDLRELLAVGLGCVLLAPIGGRTIGWPFEQWLFAAPALPFGWAFGRCLAAGQSLASIRSRVANVALFIVLGGVIVTWCVPTAGAVVFRYALAAGVLGGAAYLPQRRLPIVAVFTPLLLGTYVLHPAVYSLAVQPWLSRAFPKENDWLALSVHTVLTLALTLTVVALLRRSPLRKML